MLMYIRLIRDLNMIMIQYLVIFNIWGERQYITVIVQYMFISNILMGLIITIWT